ncbi:M23 family metallopeptidase [Haematomicrobium sanguinis]|uniref:M23 family metallopeptidase n=1 Tax=Haematomicrobium sanguinis TaxID=479106 RepID=UPI000A028343|nr:M23 family metallopeptidase [Haematomicrobium sanguinis]
MASAISFHDARRRVPDIRTHLALVAGLLVSVALVLVGTGSALAGVGAPAGWAWPLSPVPEVVRDFDKPPKNWMPGHRGVDLAAGAGQEVLAPADGTVWFVGVVVDRPVLSVRHDNGVLTSYEPVESELKVGDRVLRGEVIGTVAAMLHDGQSAIHWGAREDGEYVNPLQFVRETRPSVLLPWNG